jgi:Relaxase/Mobilisation nuclease domain
MHATIDSNQNIARSLQYHELKVKKNIAECISGDNFIKDVEDLSYVDKLYHFQRLTVQNELSEMNTLHIFMEFNEGEKVANDQLALIAKEYMSRMGWDHQPWLLYRHNDAHNLHTHIVSTIIQEKGKRMEITLPDYYKSRKLTHELEKRYSLQLSGPEARKELSERYPVQTIEYGKMSLLPAMSKVLEVVVPEYLFTSLPELNAILRLYNMEATRGKEQSRTYRNGGLIFQPLTPDGKPGGTYIKASLFDCRPTLKNLEEKFALNLSLREPHRQRLTSAIEWELAGDAPSFTGLREALERERISVVERPGKEGGPAQAWYVDHQAKTVFEDVALGTPYSIEAIRKRCISEELYQQKLQLKPSLTKELRLRL